MGKTLLVAVSIAAFAWIVSPIAAKPQEILKTASEMKAAAEAELHGRPSEMDFSNPLARWSTPMDGGPDAKAFSTLEWFQLPSPPKEPAGPAGTVSVNGLKHQIPKAARKPIERAQKFSESGNYAAAAQELEKAAALDPDNPDILNNLGSQFYRLWRFAEAAAQLKRAIELDPSSSVAHSNLGAVWLAQGDRKSAEREARRAIELSPSNPRAHFLLGMILVDSPSSRAEGMQNLEYASRSVPAVKSIIKSLREK